MVKRGLLIIAIAVEQAVAVTKQLDGALPLEERIRRLWLNDAGADSR